MSEIGLLAGIPPAVPEGSDVAWNLNCGLFYIASRIPACLCFMQKIQVRMNMAPIKPPPIITIISIPMNQLTNFFVSLST